MKEIQELSSQQLFSIYTAQIVMRLRAFHPQPISFGPEPIAYDAGVAPSQAAREEHAYVIAQTISWLHANGIMIGEADDTGHVHNGRLSARGYVIARQSLPPQSTVRVWQKAQLQDAAAASTDLAADLVKAVVVVTAAGQIPIDVVNGAIAIGERFLAQYVE